MKRPILLGLFLLILIGTKAQSTNLIGKWLCIEHGDSLYFEFTKDSLLFISGIGVEGVTESTNDEDTIGGKNYPYEVEDDDVIFLDFTFKTTANKPSHLYFVSYYTGTKNPYLIEPILLKQQSKDSITILFLTARSNHSDEEGIVYQSTADWQLAENTITAALAGDNSIAYDKFILTRLPKK